MKKNSNSKNSPDVDLPVRGADHLHLRDLAVDDLRRDVELVDHAERDRAAAGLQWWCWWCWWWWWVGWGGDENRE